MLSEKKVLEAKETCTNLIALTNAAIKELKIAGRWGIVDLAGGKKFSSAFKRNKISAYRKSARKLEREAGKLRRQIKSLGIETPNTPKLKSGGVLGGFIDIFADNFVFDAFTQANISSTVKSLEEFRHELKLVQRDLKRIKINED